MIYAQATTEHGLRAKKYSCGRDGPSYDTASSEGPSPCNIRRRDARSCTQDVGNAFVFSPDALATVLALPLPRAAFRPHVAKIERTCAWLERQDRGGGGWRSDHLEEGSGAPLAWSTAQALQCAGAASKVVGDLLNKRILAEFGGREGKAPDATVFEGLLDSDMACCLCLQGPSTPLTRGRHSLVGVHTGERLAQGHFTVSHHRTTYAERVALADGL